MSSFPYGQQVTSGTPADATDFNNGRKDGLTRFIKFEVTGPISVANKQGGVWPMPFPGSVIKINSIVDSGSAAIAVINGNGTVTINSESVSTTMNEDTTISNPSFVKDDQIYVNVTSSSGAVHLIVIMEVLPTP